MNRKMIISGCITVLFTMCSVLSFAGTGKVKFGAYSGGGGGCGGTGICQAGVGAAVSTKFTTGKDASGPYTMLTITMDYKEAAANGFAGDAKGGKYVFSNGYPFNHAEDRPFGVPADYSIPANYVCIYDGADAKGSITLTVIQPTK